MNFKSTLLVIALFGLVISCQTDATDSISSDSSMKKETLSKSETLNNKLISSKKIPASLISETEKDLEKIVEPSPCGPTSFDQVINESVSSNIDGLGSSWYGEYAAINQWYAILNNDKQTFGNNGQYTNFMVKTTRNLEGFWGMPDEIFVKGQHNSTLEDKEKIIFVYMNLLGWTYEESEVYADYFINYVNPTSTFLTETPLLSFDGFAWAPGGYLGLNDMIVIGDGLVELLAETGIDEKVVWTGIMAHEWAHHIQFNNNYMEYWFYQFDNEPERTRASELEADFYAAYYMTHKKGSTYNWKRTEAFLKAFYEIGDCQFGSDGHHGTPAQRLKSSYSGYELAANAQKKGKIMSQQELHEIFITLLPELVAVP